MSLLVVHRQAASHPMRPGARRWLLAPSGAVYWLQDRGPAYGWAVYDTAGATVADGLATLADVRRWVLAGEAVPA